ncbi:MAG: GNAT family N-acetyltransferase [Thermoplasmata archaeon]|nr:GNAT family N-acetyltransferase [Thermoplasmata archaeon]
MDPTNDLSPLTDAPPEALRLLAQGMREWTGAGPSWGLDALAALQAGVRSGALAGRMWVGPSGEAVAIGIWHPGTPAGRRVTVLMDHGYRSAAPLAEFVRRLDQSDDDGPLLSIEEPIPGVLEGSIASALAPMGFHRVLRLDHEFPAGRSIPRTDAPPQGSRGMLESDAEGLERLLQEGYSDDPIERALTRYTVDPAMDPRHSVEHLLSGGIGPWWGDASFVVVDPVEEGRLLAATVVNDHDGPLLTQVVVAPKARRRGLARALVAESIAAVRRRSSVPLRLVVTVSNRRAAELYLSIGFVPLPGTLGGYWLAPRALRPEPPDPS